MNLSEFEQAAKDSTDQYITTAMTAMEDWKRALKDALNAVDEQSKHSAVAIMLSQAKRAEKTSEGAGQ